MNPDDDDSVINQLKYPRLSIDYLPKLGVDFIRSLQNRSLQHHGKCFDLQAFAEDELVRKEYKEVHCEMPGVPRSTFLMVFSPDGTKVASTHGNHNIYITDLRTGKNVKILIGHPRTPWCIAFHPSYNDIIASGCLGGQVRIWDLAGASEVWTAENETVIASIAFHPIDRMLVIATFNELHFWDWSKAKPFACIATANTKEKVRYVEFDRMGHKLITGITNVPQSRWDRNRTNSSNRVERGRFPLTPPSPPDRSANQYRRRVTTPRVVSTFPYSYSQASTSSAARGDRVPLSSVPERERRITACYRNLVHEYELLVHRYLQVYSPPTTIDRGTDPMEMDEPIPGSSSSHTLSANSSNFCQTNFRLINSSNLGNDTSAEPSTSGSPNAQNPTGSPSNDVQIHCGLFFSRIRESHERTSSTSVTNHPVRRRLLLRTLSGIPSNSSNDSTEPSESNTSNTSSNASNDVKLSFKMRIKCSKAASKEQSSSGKDRKVGSLRINTTNLGPTSTTNSSSTSGRSLWSAPLKRLHPTFIKSKKMNRKPILESSSDNSSSDEDIATKRVAANRRKEPSKSAPSTSSTQDNLGGNNPSEEEICLPNFIARGTNNAPVCSSCSTTPSATGCARTSQITQPCARTLVNTNTTTTDSTVYTPSGGPHVATHPGYYSIQFPEEQLSRSQSDIRRLHPLERNPSSISSPQDEVVNYAERSNSEDEGDQTQPIREFHPFDPPPEFPSINPENIGIGNMYSNIVQDLESSLNNVRTIRASHRPGETSDMLSSFSDRLESIMHQSDTILRNLSHSMDMIPPSTEPIEISTRGSSFGSPTSPVTESLESDSPNGLEDPESTESRVLAHIERISDLSRDLPSERSSLSGERITGRVVFNDDLFYMREYNQTSRSENGNDSLSENIPQDLFNNRSAIASDHSYHVGSPRVVQQPDNLTPLMTSLHLTISHIRRQARLLRRQVDSIERLDRAMLEVAQLQSVRQLFGELRRHLSNLAGEHRSTGVSSVRQMMAGTRISDTSPCDSGGERESTPSPLNNSEMADSDPEQQPARQTNTGRKQLPPSRLLHLQRQNRRFAVVNLLPRRNNARNRYARQRLYFRAFSVRRRTDDPPTQYFGNTVNSNILSVMTRRLEMNLAVHINIIGRHIRPNTNNTYRDEMGEVAINQRLRICRIRLNRILSSTLSGHIETNTSVTVDGARRYSSRNTLSRILETLTLYFSQNSYRFIPPVLHTQIRNVIDLTSLLSDILLLQIVDSIPPPTGINLNPERESLSASIEQMCTRMLQQGLIRPSESLDRSLHLLRLTTRSSSQSLDQTYNARCNAIFTNSNSSRREILGQIHSTLRSIRTRGMPHYIPLSVLDHANNQPAPPPNYPRWYPMNTYMSPAPDSASSVAAQDASNSDDDNDAWYNDPRQSLYRTANVNLVSEEASLSPSPTPTFSRIWNVPAVQLNDIPITESLGGWQGRIPLHRYRLSDLRSNPMLNFFRPRFLHPLYAGGPLFDSNDLEDRRQDQLSDGEAIMTFTPNHRIQAWDVSTGDIPDISNSSKNIVVGECKIHNDASVDLSTDGTLLVTLLPSGGYLNVTNRLGVYSLRWESLGQILYITSFEQNVVSVSLSPLSRHLVVGLASRRVSIIPNERWTMARIFLLSPNDFPYGGRLPVLRELEQNRDTSYMSLNCIRWLPASGQGLIIATNTGQLRILS